MVWFIRKFRQTFAETVHILIVALTQESDYENYRREYGKKYERIVNSSTDFFCVVDIMDK